MYVQGFKDNGVTVPCNYVYTVPLLKKVLLTQILQKALFLFIENHSEIIMIHYQTNKITPAL